MGSKNKYFYYISSGDLNRMYTLRVSFQEVVSTAGVDYQVVRDYYCCNLSTDRTKAYEKAKAYIDGKTDSALVDQDKVPTLEEIYRRSQEELEQARLAAAATETAAQIAFEERCYQARAAKIDLIQAGIWPFGKYKGTTIGREWGADAADHGYIRFFLNLEPGHEENTDANHAAVLATLRNFLKAKFGWLLELPKPNGEWYGKVKARPTFDLTLVNIFHYTATYGYNQVLVTIQKFVKDTGECIVYRGSSPIDCKLGEQVRVVGTIKEHSTYKGENQTIIQRPKKLKV